MKFRFEDKIAVALYLACLLLVFVGSVVTGQNSYPFRYQDSAPLQTSPIEPQ